MSTYIGTCHFNCFGSAWKYYNPLGVSHSELRKKIKRGEIVIGEPPTKKNEKVFLNDEGRYIIEEMEITLATEKASAF